jgi:diguanylate cyclase (GGDEF)-like protein
MPHLIDSVAALIDVRDKDHLERTLASVLFDLIGASALRLWRVVPRNGEIKLRERVRLGGPNATRVRHAGSGVEVDLRRASCELRAAHDTGLQSRLPRRSDESSRHVFPILDDSKTIGLLEIDLPSPMSAEQKQLAFGLLRIYRSHLGVLDFGDTDELTGLSNRRPFEDAFRRVSESARRADTSAPRGWLAVADIDFFKRINDQFGHAYGDEVLVLLTRLMRHCFGEHADLFRFGGEEFVVLLASPEADEAREVLERFREAVAAFAFPRVGHVTISIGVTAIQSFDTGGDAFGRADEALYIAKQSGRNRLCRYEELVADGTLALKKVEPMDVEMF